MRDGMTRHEAFARDAGRVVRLIVDVSRYDRWLSCRALAEATATRTYAAAVILGRRARQVHPALRFEFDTDRDGRPLEEGACRSAS
jgi:hypothetical protein